MSDDFFLHFCADCPQTFRKEVDKKNRANQGVLPILFEVKKYLHQPFYILGQIQKDVFTCGFSPGLRTQLVQWKNSDNLLFPHKVHQPKSVEARLSKPSSLYYSANILTIYFFPIRYINLKVWRQNYQNFPSKARYINLKVWRFCAQHFSYNVPIIYPA